MSSVRDSPILRVALLVDVSLASPMLACPWMLTPLTAIASPVGSVVTLTMGERRLACLPVPSTTNTAKRQLLLVERPAQT